MWKSILKSVCTTSLLHTGCVHVCRCWQRFGPNHCGLCKWVGAWLGSSFRPGCVCQTGAFSVLLLCSCLQDAEWQCWGRNHVAFRWPTAAPQIPRGLNRETQKPRETLWADILERLCRQWVAAIASRIRSQNWWQALPLLWLAPEAPDGHVPAPPAASPGGCCLWPGKVFAHQPYSSVVVNSSWVLAFFFNTFKSEPYCILKHRRFPIQIPDVLVWINNTVASKVPAAKGKLWLPASTKLGLRGETWHVLLMCLLSSQAGVRRLHVLGL